jgi:Sec-independent protein translocase protein TatA
MDALVTWENGLFAAALMIAVSSLVALMRTMRDRLVNEITQKIELERDRHRVDQEREEKKQAEQEKRRHQDEQIERIRDGRPAA